MKSMALVALSLWGMWGVGLPAIADQLAPNPGGAVLTDANGTRIMGNQQKGSFDCDEKAVSVIGSDGVITLEGRCPALTVLGENNVIQVEAVGPIQITGNRNRVLWISGLDGKVPAVQKSGNDNIVLQTPQ